MFKHPYQVTEKRLDDWQETFEISTLIMQDLVLRNRVSVLKKDNVRSHAMLTECTKDF